MIADPAIEDLAPAPWWVRAAVHVGLPTAAFAVLLWFTLGRMTGVLDKLAINDSSIIANQQMIISNQVEISRLLRDHEQTTAGTQRVILCLSLAHIDAERTRCFQER